MKETKQFDDQSVYEHCVSVKDHLIKVLDALDSKKLDYKLPSWFKYSDLIKDKLLSRDILFEYVLWHDIGKPFCIEVIDGIRHFPNHAKVSYEIYNQVFDNKIVAELIVHDMDIHIIKEKDIQSFIQNEYCLSLLVVGFAEIIANSKFFGGEDSISYKMKFKQIDRRGSSICNKMFNIKI